jgi:ADP-ribose pyrophosphatase YjhB (NUDIX family)
MKIQKIPFPEFKKIYSRVPRLCVEVVLMSENKILMTKRSIAPAVGQWHTPGGTVLKGESLEMTVKRVAKEELGVSVKVLKFLGVIEYKSFVNHYSQDISLPFLVETKNKKDFKLDGHADKCDFFEEIPMNTIREQKEFYSKNLRIRLSKKNTLDI